VTQTRTGPRRIVAAALAVAVSVVLAAPAMANSTKPPLPPELAGLPQIEVSYGQSITLQFTGTPPDFEHPISCGELGCIYHTIGWDLPPGSGPTTGCSARDTSCTFVYTPPGHGDAGEAWQKATVAHLAGSSTVSATSYAILGTVGKYTVYPELTFPPGDPDTFAAGRTVYLVRSGTTPDVSSCSTTFGDPESQAIADCLAISGSGGARNLPEGSTWTIYGSLTSGGAGQVSQLAGIGGFSSKSVTVASDNVFGAPVRVTHVPRPTLSVTVADLPTSIPLDQTATVHVTVTAVGGQGGRVDAITFPRGLLTSGGSSLETALQIVSPSSSPSPFALSSGQSRTFDVTVKGVQVRNNVFVSSQASGSTDEGQSRFASADPSKTNVVDGPPPPPVDPPGDPGTAPQPPVITAATGGAPGLIRGTVTGSPGSSVQVRLATAPSSASCPRQMTGAGIASVSSLSVAIPASGTASFSQPAPLVADGWTYGTTVASSRTSDVSACRRVDRAPSAVGLSLAKKQVKGGKRGKATVTVTASGLTTTGTVTIREGRHVVGTATLTPADHGRAIIKLAKLPEGKHTLTAVYAGSADAAASTSPPVVLTVKPRR
jgi:hypothetical protein